MSEHWNWKPSKMDLHAKRKMNTTFGEKLKKISEEIETRDLPMSRPKKSLKCSLKLCSLGAEAVDVDYKSDYDKLSNI